ncbi:MAG: hypothetical protein M1305_04280, partial [Candidatus Marsarchaeota archaeon]|nr:hypothetical protein [Candidatus Marsarchaeota archaeon]
YYVWPKPEPITQRLGPTLAGAVDLLSPVVIAICLLLSLYALWLTVKARRHLALSLVVGSMLFLAVTRFPLNDRYSYFKSLTFSTFVATSLAVMG